MYHQRLLGGYGCHCPGKKPVEVVRDKVEQVVVTGQVVKWVRRNVTGRLKWW